MLDIFIVCLSTVLLITASVIGVCIYIVRNQKSLIERLTDQLISRSVGEFNAMQQVRARVDERKKVIHFREPVPEKETKPFDPILGNNW